MGILLRKIKTAWYLAKDFNWFAIFTRAKRNIKELILSSKKGVPFTYRTNTGFWFVCFPESCTSRQIYLDGFPEDIEAKIAYAWIEPGDSCLDIGASVGYYSALFSSRIGSSGKVISVEASPVTAVFLEKMTKKIPLRQICIENACVAEKTGYAEFMVSKTGGREPTQSMKVTSATRIHYKSETVKVVTIDSLLEKHELVGKVSLVKIDIEGAEPLALSGGSLLFKKDLPLFLIELNRAGLAEFGFEIADSMKFFPEDLFEIYYVHRSLSDTSLRSKYGSLHCLRDFSAAALPYLSNLIIIPRKGKYAIRRKNIEGKGVC